MENIESKVVLSMLKHYGKTVKKLESEWEKENSAEDVKLFDKLKELNLTKATNRFGLFWSMENLLEKIIYENSYLENSEVLLKTVETWNKSNDIKIELDAASYLLNRKGFKNDSEKRAFLAICDGEIETYKIYQKDEPTIFINILVRYLMAYFNNKEQVIAVGQQIIEDLFGEEYNTLFEKGFNDVFGMLRNFNRPSKPSVTYSKCVSLDSFVFSTGLKSIISPFITVENNIAEVNQDNQVDIDLEREGSSMVDTSSVEKSEQNCKENKVDILETMSTTINLLNNQLQELMKEMAEKSETVDIQIKEKTAFLESQVNLLNSKLEEAREASIIELIRKIAGKGAGYQFSELYMETTGDKASDRDIIVGKLVNLFSMFELEEIYPYDAGRTIGSKFSISKSDIAKKFMVADSIKTTDEMVNVELLQYGWNYKNKQVVMPLVREII